MFGGYVTTDMISSANYTASRNTQAGFERAISVYIGWQTGVQKVRMISLIRVGIAHVN